MVFSFISGSQQSEPDVCCTGHFSGEVIFLQQLFEPALIGMFAIAVAIAVTLLFVNAPYGRYLRGGWGPPINARAGWMIMETPAVVTIAVLFATGRQGIVETVFLMLWQSHYLYRTYVFPLRLKHPRPMPLLVPLMAVVFNIWNGFLNGAWLFHLGPQRSTEWLLSAPFIAGTVLFFAGMFINRQSDRIIMNLRSPGETGYKVPRGGFYRFVTMPSYFGEFVQWLGFALATWSLAGLSFAVFTAANLFPRALANHRWYRETFPDYPKERRAVIPFIL